MESNFVAKRATEISFYKKKGLLLRNDLITARKYSHWERQRNKALKDLLIE